MNLLTRVFKARMDVNQAMFAPLNIRDVRHNADMLQNFGILNVESSGSGSNSIEKQTSGVSGTNSVVSEKTRKQIMSYRRSMIKQRKNEENDKLVKQETSSTNSPVLPNSIKKTLKRNLIEKDTDISPTV